MGKQDTTQERQNINKTKSNHPEVTKQQTAIAAGLPGKVNREEAQKKPRRTNKIITKTAKEYKKR